MTKLQWLVLLDEASKTYTNFGDGRPGDASELVVKVNADPGLNQGQTDWRLPTRDELKGLIGTGQAPEKGRYWSSRTAYGICNGWYVCFNDRHDYYCRKSNANRVRLVRSIQ